MLRVADSQAPPRLPAFSPSSPKALARKAWPQKLCACAAQSLRAWAAHAANASASRASCVRASTVRLVSRAHKLGCAALQACTEHCASCVCTRVQTLLLRSIGAVMHVLQCEALHPTQSCREASHSAARFENGHHACALLLLAVCLGREDLQQSMQRVSTPVPAEICTRTALQVLIVACDEHTLRGLRCRRAQSKELKVCKAYQGGSCFGGNSSRRQTLLKLHNLFAIERRVVTVALRHAPCDLS